jgi:thiamine-phosphate pyrophosphorylase
MVQYRAKEATLTVRRRQAAALAALCRALDVPLIVNDSVDLAIAVRADGVHLGRDDGNVRVRARPDAKRPHRRVVLRRSLARPAAAAAGADYVAIGSVFASSTKPGAVRAPLARLAEAKRLSNLPVVAIGGITAANAAKRSQPERTWSR